MVYIRPLEIILVKKTTKLVYLWPNKCLVMNLCNVCAQILKKQVETAGSEWACKSAEWQTEQKQAKDTISSLTQENIKLKNKVI